MFLITINLNHTQYWVWFKYIVLLLIYAIPQI
nr:MAG TPA: hypothetical protein [Caudoviricetes sp.]